MKSINTDYEFTMVKSDLDKVDSDIQDGLKSRGRKELFLVLACLLVFTYIYPAKDLQANAKIEIPAISVSCCPLLSLSLIFEKRM